jgi:feruloyl esterase
MKKTLWSGALAAALCVGTPHTLIAAAASAGSDAGRCEAVRSLVIDSTTKVLDASVTPPGFVAPGPSLDPHNQPTLSKSFCRVIVAAEPEADSHIEYEVWLPLESEWNGRLQGVGGAGNSGAIIYGGLIAAVESGFVGVSTDNGHENVAMSDQQWAIGHPAKVADFGFRAVHVSTVGAKVVVDAYYHRPAHHSYWVGCSQGGNKGLMLAQRWPLDYDGVIAGDPVRDWTRAMASITQVALQQLRDSHAFIPQDKRALIHQAVLQQCDAVDGVKDGIISAPQKCHFNPEVLQCKKGKNAQDCLTSAQVNALVGIYRGLKQADGRVVLDGFLPGSEQGWSFLGASRPSGNWSGFWPMVVHENPGWDLVASFSLASDFELARRKVGWAYDADNPDLRPFAARGGKLLMYHGLADPLISPLQSSRYLDDVVSTMGPEAAARFARLYLIGGMGHCGGGEGADTFDLLPALVDWVERDSAPADLVAARVVGGQTQFTRPLCAYPSVVQYNGAGSAALASNFTCR